jgi:hypothetical protein
MKLKFQTDPVRGAERVRLRERLRREPQDRPASAADRTEGLRLPVDGGGGRRGLLLQEPHSPSKGQ